MISEPSSSHKSENFFQESKYPSAFQIKLPCPLFALPESPNYPHPPSSISLSACHQLTFELFTFAATAVRQLRVRALAGLAAPLPGLRLRLRRLLPGQGPVLRLGRPQLLPLLPHGQKVAQSLRRSRMWLRRRIEVLRADAC